MTQSSPVGVQDISLIQGPYGIPGVTGGNLRCGTKLLRVFAYKRGHSTCPMVVHTVLNSMTFGASRMEAFTNRNSQMKKLRLKFS
jgi:hypothetical protein